MKQSCIRKSARLLLSSIVTSTARLDQFFARKVLNLDIGLIDVKVVIAMHTEPRVGAFLQHRLCRALGQETDASGQNVI